jgi:probable DNA repair protein
MSTPTHSVYICSTPRLARSVRNRLHRQSRERGEIVWAAPKVLTLTQWLQSMTMQGVLCGEIPPDTFPSTQLSAFAENLLWQQAISDCLQRHELAALFDVKSLADTAQRAHQLLIEWQVPESALNHAFISTETRQFLRWRNVFISLRAKIDAREPASLLALQAGALKMVKNGLPDQLIWLGFDRLTPLEKSLIDTLREKSIQVAIEQPKAAQTTVQQTTLSDIHAECRAAVAWAKAQLDANPQAQLAIVSPVMHQIRRVLQDLLDDTFHETTLHANQHETPRIYDFSLGEALADQSMIRTALNLLRLSSSQQKLPQASVSALLLDVYWSAWYERDLRAQIDAQLRKKLLRNVSLDQVEQLTETQHAASQLHAHLHTMQGFQALAAKRKLPSEWRVTFEAHLQQLNWAQSRPLSSFEFQAKTAWQKALQQLTELDGICSAITGSEAVRQLYQICAQLMFQPESTGEVRIQLLGMLETPAEALDGVWVIGMNDLHWPPLPKPNALLPHDIQRQFGMPAADTASQTAFARKVFERLSQSATQMTFSYAHKDGERELRASPLLSDLPTYQATMLTSTMAERMANPTPLAHLEDHVAPPVSAGEKISGGTRLLEAQAICPAWAFYQFRLGARKLEEPSDGLDSQLRGNLVHAALQYFWSAHPHSDVLKQAGLDEKIATAVNTAIAQHLDAGSFPDALMRIEQRRLQQLLALWLAVEAERQPFSVQDCEKEAQIAPHGLQITCRIDRIDRIAEGLVIIDYKTGALPKTTAWVEERITEPQLPLYASIALQNEQIVAACFARVNSEECVFNGASAVDFGAGVKAIQDLSAQNKLKAFGDFDALLQHWHDSLHLLAQEIMQGVANVRFSKEADLVYCDVKPLLRLPEREWQFEHLPVEPSHE